MALDDLLFTLMALGAAWGASPVAISMATGSPPGDGVAKLAVAGAFFAFFEVAWVAEKIRGLP